MLIPDIDPPIVTTGGLLGLPVTMPLGIIFCLDDGLDPPAVGEFAEFALASPLRYSGVTPGVEKS